MNLASLIISVLSLLATVIIGLKQIKLSRNQKSIEVKLRNIENKNIQRGNGNSMRGIIGNSNNGNISNNLIS
jgi:hypothetical protein